MKHTERYLKLVKQWSPRNEKPLDAYKSYSKEKAWWVCENGHEWLASIKGRFSNHGCPYCGNKLPVKGVNDVATLMPSLLLEWHPSKNGDTSLSDYRMNSEKKVWWVCSSGHEWQAPIVTRTKGHGCPICAKRIAGQLEHNLLVDFPSVAANWNYEKNEYPPEHYCPHSAKHVWWKCKNGHEWHATIHEMTGKRRQGSCPYCSGHRPIEGETDMATLYPDLVEEWDYSR